ncbi:MAG: S26 family signal peptidase [Burkholderiales bacterium]|nr:S26 family signal peptidase [Burkholderiales bacterium]
MNQIVYNPTISLTKGYYFTYRASSYKVGDIVLFCVGDITQARVMHKLGLPYINGECVHNTPYLMKRIVAMANDVVEITALGILVNGHLLPNSIPLLNYRMVKLPRIRMKKVKLKMDEFLVMGQTAHSYDSRYFGIIKEAQIYHEAYLLLALNSPIL